MFVYLFIFILQDGPNGAVSLEVFHEQRIEVVFCTFFFRRAKEIIRKAIKDNDFLTNLELSQVQELVECMYQMEFKKTDYIIREGEPGSHLYVIEGMSQNLMRQFIILSPFVHDDSMLFFSVTFILCFQTVNDMYSMPSY